MDFYAYEPMPSRNAYEFLHRLILLYKSAKITSKEFVLLTILCDWYDFEPYALDVPIGHVAEQWRRSRKDVKRALQKLHQILQISKTSFGRFAFIFRT